MFMFANRLRRVGLILALSAITLSCADDATEAPSRQCAAALVAQAALPDGGGPCAEDDDCSFNGACDAATCSCTAPWTGLNCNKLRIAPVDKAVYGYREGYPHTTSWGASVQYDVTSKQYLMLVSEYVGECSNWGYNSTVVLATSAKPEGPYERQYRVFGVMSHEAMWARGPDGEWVMYFTASKGADGKPRAGDEQVDPALVCVRENYDEPCVCPGPPEAGSKDPTWMSWTKTPLDSKSWSDPILVFDPGGHFTDMTGSGELAESIDANFNGIIRPDGSFVGLWRTWQCVEDLVAPWRETLSEAEEGACFSVPHTVTVKDWLDPAGYQDAISKTKGALAWLFPAQYTPPQLALGLEDPMIYRDKRSPPVFHAIFHDMFIPGDMVAHAYSEDGVDWTFTGDVLPRDPESNSAVAHFTDGTCKPIDCERPQLIVREGVPSHLTIGGIPTALSDDAQDSASSRGWPGGATLVIPLVTP